MADAVQEIVGVDFVAAEPDPAGEEPPAAVLARALDDENRPPRFAGLRRETEGTARAINAALGARAGPIDAHAFFPRALERLRPVGQKRDRQEALQQVRKQHAGQRAARARSRRRSAGARA